MSERRLAAVILWSTCTFWAACASTRPDERVNYGSDVSNAPREESRREVRYSRTTERAIGSVELFFRGDQPFARRQSGPECSRGYGCDEWPISGVRRQEMVLSPDHKHFAHLRNTRTASLGSAVHLPRIIVRNVAGDPVNELSIYRSGSVVEMAWVDNRRIAYLAQVSEPNRNANSNVFVLHDVMSGEIVSARSGSDFVWCETKKHVVFTSGARGRQTVVVDGNTVWPRAGMTELVAPPTCSPNGHGVAFIESRNRAPRLVVLAEYSDSQGDMVWELPRQVMGSGVKVFWTNPSTVVLGEDLFHPMFTANWERLQ